MEQRTGVHRGWHYSAGIINTYDADKPFDPVDPIGQLAAFLKSNASTTAEACLHLCCHWSLQCRVMLLKDVVCCTYIVVAWGLICTQYTGETAEARRALRPLQLLKAYNCHKHVFGRQVQHGAIVVAVVRVICMSCQDTMSREWKHRTQEGALARTGPPECH